MDFADLPEQIGSVPNESEQATLVENLLGVRRLGPPPFLVRNLHYVKREKEKASNKIWDLRWGETTARGEKNSRQLLLKCMPKRCVLPDAFIKRHFGRSSSPTPRTNLNSQYQGKLRLWLSVVLPGDECIAFGVRESAVCLWPKTLADAGAPLEDLNVSQSFDLSAIMAFLAHFPARMSVIVELYAMKPGALNDEQTPLLRGEQYLLDTNYSMATSVPNKDFVIDLFRPSKENILKKPAMGIRPKLESEQSDVMSDIGPLTNGPTQTNDAVMSSASLNSSTPSSSDSCGTMTLSLRGTLNKRDVAPETFDPFCEQVMIRCSYKSAAFPWWDGLTRHDFICPWCHRNCRRLRTLLFHFHLDHDRAQLSLDAQQQSGESTNDPFFTLNLTISPAPAYNGGDKRPTTADAPRTRASSGRNENANGNANGADDERANDVDENVMFNRVRYPRYPPNTEAEKTTDDLDMTKCTVRDSTNEFDADSDATVVEDDPEALLERIMREGWKKCQHCNRPHQCLYRSNIQFCSEWCEVASRSNFEVEEEGESSSGRRRTPSSSILGSSTRRPRINFQETLGKRTLYHVVSLSPVHEEHFDEENADSEDEVDHSWRLRITEDKLHHLEGPTAKERVLWILWNRYAHENYPAPGAYAERYTRYSLEVFVFEYGTEIHRLQLRVALVGFLRALHIHGVIDAEGFRSVLLCLDGKKKRQHCRISRRAELGSVYQQHRNRTRKPPKSSKSGRRR